MQFNYISTVYSIISILGFLQDVICCPVNADMVVLAEHYWYGTIHQTNIKPTGNSSKTEKKIRVSTGVKIVIYNIIYSAYTFIVISDWLSGWLSKFLRFYLLQQQLTDTSWHREQLFCFSGEGGGVCQANNSHTHTHTMAFALKVIAITCPADMFIIILLCGWKHYYTVSGLQLHVAIRDWHTL